MCAKCSNRSSCKRPCYFVSQILNFENSLPFEIEIEGRIILLPKRGQTRESELFIYDDSGTKEPDGDIAFSTDNESAFLNAVNVETKQTGIFIDIFFNRFSYTDCAVKYDTTSQNVATIYSMAKTRIIEILNADTRKAVGEKALGKTASMSKDMRRFLMHTIFNLTPGEISELLNDNDLGNRLTRRSIEKIRDRVLAGDMDLSDFLEGDKTAAMERIEKLKASRKIESQKRLIKLKAKMVDL